MLLLRKTAWVVLGYYFAWQSPSLPWLEAREVNMQQTTTSGQTTQRPDEDIRVPTVKEHLLRVFGHKRGESLYGSEGDKLAAQYPQKKWNWVLGYDEPIPLFLEQSRQNQAKAYCVLIGAALITVFMLSSFVRSANNESGYNPSGELSPAERLLMNTAQQSLGVSDKAMRDYYAPPVEQAPPLPEQTPATEQQAPPQQHHPPSMRTFGLRAQQQQAQMQQQQYGGEMPMQQQQQYGMPAQQGQPQRFQVYVSR